MGERKKVKKRVESEKKFKKLSRISWIPGKIEENTLNSKNKKLVLEFFFWGEKERK